MRTLVWAIFLMLAVAFSSAPAEAQTKGGEHGEETAGANIFLHLVSLLSAQNGVVQETFTGERARSFMTALAGVYPGEPMSADAVITFSAEGGKTSLFFFNRGCVSGEGAFSSLFYQRIKAAMPAQEGQETKP